MSFEVTMSHKSGSNVMILLDWCSHNKNFSIWDKDRINKKRQSCSKFQLPILRPLQFHSHIPIITKILLHRLLAYKRQLLLKEGAEKVEKVEKVEKRFIIENDEELEELFQQEKAERLLLYLNILNKEADAFSQEIYRQERVARSLLYKSIGLYRRQMLRTKSFSLFLPGSERPILPPPVRSPTLDYTGGTPTRGSFYSPKPKRRVSITDQIIVNEEQLKESSDKKSQSWKSISNYAPVRYMIMQDLKAQFGSDAADPEGWVSKIEDYSFSQELDIDTIYCQIKDSYQELYNEEEADWTNLMMLEHSKRQLVDIYQIFGPKLFF